MTGIEGSAGELAEDQLGLARELRTAEAQMDSATSAFGDAMGQKAGAMASADAGRLAGRAAAQNDKSAAEMDGILMTTAQQVDGQIGALAASEQSMKRGVKRLASDSAKLQTSLGSLRGKAGEINKDVEREFAGAISALAADKLQQYETDEALRSGFKAQRAALERVFQQRISKMSAEDQQRYQEEVDAKMKELEQKMQSSDLSVEAKKKLLAKANQEIKGTLTDLYDEALVSEEELQAIQREMLQTGESVSRVVDGAYEELSAEKLLLQESQEKQREALEKRAQAIKDAIGAAGPSLEGKYGAEVDKVLNAANAEILEVANAEHLDDAEKTRRIKAIEARSKARLEELGKLQVAAQNDLASFAEMEADFDKKMEDQLLGVRSVLKDEKKEFVQHILDERRVLEKQTSEMAGIVQGVLAMIAEQEESTGQQLSAQEQARKLSLQKIVVEMTSEAQEKTTTAQQALSLSESAKAGSENTKAVEEAQLGAIESKLNVLTTREANQNSNLKQRIHDETRARQAAVANEKKVLRQSGGSVASKQKQDVLTNRIRDLVGKLQAAAAQRAEE